MNTPSHVAASLLVWRNESEKLAVIAVAVGAVLPDLPMFGFYGYQRLIAGSSEREIWSTLYFEPHWQLFFDLFNSIPIAAILIAICSLLRFRLGVLVAASALLHMCCDLPVHNDDAHRHFLPLSNWRFESPVSYWDPNHHGIYFAMAELAFSIAACSFIAWKTKARPMRIASICTLLFYGAGIVFALLVWIL